MKSNVEVHQESVWESTAQVPSFAPLREDVTADVCVVGAGIAGLSTAYELASAGQKVVVLDDGPICGGQTQMTTAHLASAIDDRYYEMERLHGREGAQLAAQSHARAIDRIEEIVAREQIACDFRRVDGFLFSAPGDLQVLDRERQAAQRTGVLEVERVAHGPWRNFNVGPCLRFARQGQFHPLKYLRGLAQAITSRGGAIYCGTHARKIEGGARAQVQSADGPTVHARQIVVATNTPINDLVAIHTKQAPYLSYVIGLRVPAGSLEPALYWDTADPYHYLRLQRVNGEDAEFDVLIVGGEDHKTGQAHDGEERFARLEEWTRLRIPEAGALEFRWSGQVMETIDGLAFIGRNPLDKENVYIATGDSGMGMTHGTIAGILLCDLILGRENPWSELYDPARKTLGALGEFAKENLNVAAQYSAWVTPGEVRSVDEIPPGQGAIVRSGMSKLAVYRDPSGKLVELSAVCPHLKCVVAWNPTESSWDCPCHGSRFHADGKVFNGPANADLTPQKSGSAKTQSAAASSTAIAPATQTSR